MWRVFAGAAGGFAGGFIVAKILQKRAEQKAAGDRYYVSAPPPVQPVAGLEEVAASGCRTCCPGCAAR